MSIMLTEDSTITNQYCDRCPARARVRAHKPGGLALFFCGHHSEANISPLADQGFQIFAVKHTTEA